MKKKVPSIAPLAASFPDLVSEKDLNEIDIEWSLLRNTELNVEPDTDTYKFWQKVGDLKKGDESPLFLLVGTFMKKLLCLPHSSASEERMFSQVNLMKTNVCKSLNTDALNGMLHAKKKNKKKNRKGISPQF